MTEHPLVVPLDQYAAVDLVGSKAAGLQRLICDGLPVPPGFVVTTAAYRRAAGAVAADRRDSADAWPLPPALVGAIGTAYERLVGPSSAGQPAVAVRSSATLEDLPDAAFAGLYATGTGIRGVNEMLLWVQRCWASLYDPAAVVYRREHGFAEARAAMGVIVQRLIPAEVAGVAFTVDPVSGQHDRVVLNAAWGLGASVVDGLVEPDTFIVERNDLRIVSRTIGDKATRAGATPTAPREA
ncbi:MAG: PEP/pyruvate-binding domain-containing protein, partial [Chloroflexota bacterium]|nr:PEP/pyruvate-binding domain-containing protein [Chloroflexota bacterium]